MRIAAWNILDGGTGRADPLAEVLLAQRADVVALAEAQDQEVVGRLAWRLGMDFVIGEGGEGSGSSVAVLARTIRSSVNWGLLRAGGPRAWLEAHVETAEGVLPVFVAHLSARAGFADEQKRMGELEVLLGVTAGLRGRGAAHVLAGDFNANSPHQAIDVGMVKRSTREAAAGQGGVLPRAVVSAVEEAGYVDSLMACDPRAGRSVGTFTTQEPGQRVDYIFGFGVRFRSAWVELDRLAKFASDHFPVGAEFEVPGDPPRGSEPRRHGETEKKAAERGRG